MLRCDASANMGVYMHIYDLVIHSHRHQAAIAIFFASVAALPASWA